MKYESIIKIVVINLIIIFFVLQVKSLNLNEHNKPKTNESRLCNKVVLQIRKLNMILSTIDSITIKEGTSYVFIGQSFYVKKDSCLFNNKFMFSLKNKNTNETYLNFLFVISDDSSFWIPYNKEIVVQNKIIGTWDTLDYKNKTNRFGEFKIASQFCTNKHDSFTQVNYSNTAHSNDLIIENNNVIGVNMVNKDTVDTCNTTIKTDDQYNSQSNQNYYSMNEDYTGIIADPSFQSFREEELTNSNSLTTKDSKFLNIQNNLKENTCINSRDKEYRGVLADPNFISMTSRDDFQISNVKSKPYYNKQESDYKTADSPIEKAAENSNSTHYVDFSGTVADSQFSSKYNNDFP